MIKKAEKLRKGRKIIIMHPIHRYSVIVEKATTRKTNKPKNKKKKEINKIYEDSWIMDNRNAYLLMYYEQTKRVFCLNLHLRK